MLRPAQGLASVSLALIVLSCGKTSHDASTGGTDGAGAAGQPNLPSLSPGLHLIPPLPEHIDKTSPHGPVARRSDIYYVAPDASWIVLRSSYRGSTAATQALTGSQIFGVTADGVVPFGLPPWDTGTNLDNFYCDLLGVSRDASRLVIIVADAYSVLWTRQDGFAWFDGFQGMINTLVSDDAESLAGTFPRDLGGGQTEYFAAAYSTRTGYRLLDNLAGYRDCWFSALSGDGKVALGACGNRAAGPSSQESAVYWSGGSSLATLDARFGRDDCGVATVGPGTNTDGSVIVGVCGKQGFVWRASAGFSIIDAPPSSGGIPTDFTEDGSVVIGEGPVSDAPTQAYRWTASAGTQVLTPLPGHDSTTLQYRRTNGASSGGIAFGVRAMSADGSVVAGNSFDSTGTLPEQAFLFTATGGTQPLPNLPSGTSSHVNSVSQDGSIIVGYSANPSGSTAVFWDLDGTIHSVSDALTEAGLAPADLPLVSTQGAVSAHLLWGTARSDDVQWSWVLRLP